VFNACRSGLDIAARNYWDTHGRSTSAIVDGDGRYVERLQNEIDTQRFLMVVKGRCAYLKSICPKQYLQLYKLVKAVELLEAHANDVYTRRVTKESVTIKTVTPGDGTLSWTEIPKVTMKDLDGRGFNPVQQFQTRELTPEMLEAVKTYRNESESVEDFLHNLSGVLEATSQAA